MKYLNILTIVMFSFVMASCEKDSEKDKEEVPIINTVSKLSDGYVLYSFMGDQTIHLVDSTGSDVKMWTSAFRTSGGCYLSENKTLLRLGSTPEANTGTFSGGGAVGGVIEELDDNSNVIWSIRRDSDASTFHHDFKEVDENTIIALTWESVVYNGNEYWNEIILLVDKSNDEVIWEWSAIDDGALIPDKNDKIDFLHFNSIDYDNGTILVSARSQNRLYLIEQESKKITGTLTLNGTLSGQHDATLLDNGNILVFNILV